MAEGQQGHNVSNLFRSHAKSPTFVLKCLLSVCLGMEGQVWEHCNTVEAVTELTSKKATLTILNIRFVNIGRVLIILYIIRLF